MRGIHDQQTIAELTTELDTQRLSFEQALQIFESLYMASRNLAARTRKEYRSDLLQLAVFLTKHGVARPSAVRLSDLQSFLADLDRRGYTGVTRRRKTSSIKAFFGFLAQAELLNNYPCQQLIPPAREYKEPRLLTTQEYRALLRACNHETRDAAIID